MFKARHFGTKAVNKWLAFTWARGFSTLGVYITMPLIRQSHQERTVGSDMVCLLIKMLRLQFFTNQGDFGRLHGCRRLGAGGDLVKSVCVVLQQSGFFCLKDMAYFFKKTCCLPFGKVFIVYHPVFLCRFQGAKYCYGIPPLPSFHY